jgi:hypothetical protein
MCTGIETALILAGTVASVGGAVFSGIQQQQVAKANARAAGIEADRAREVGRIQEAQARDDMRRAIARQRAGLAAAGISLASPSALDLGQEAGEQAFLDAQAVRSGADARARSLDFEARLSRAEGRRALFGGFAQGAVTALSGARSALTARARLAALG